MLYQPSAGNIRLKRVYDLASPDDGFRILVDRLWPRGITKDRAALDDWPKVIAPSTELRKWFGHDPDRWTEFRFRYLGELQQQQAELGRIREMARNGVITLVYGARNQKHNHAIILREALLDPEHQTSAETRARRQP